MERNREDDREGKGKREEEIDPTHAILDKYKKELKEFVEMTIDKSKKESKEEILKDLTKDNEKLLKKGSKEIIVDTYAEMGKKVNDNLTTYLYMLDIDQNQLLEMIRTHDMVLGVIDDTLGEVLRQLQIIKTKHYKYKALKPWYNRLFGFPKKLRKSKTHKKLNGLIRKMELLEIEQLYLKENVKQTEQFANEYMDLVESLGGKKGDEPTIYKVPNPYEPPKNAREVRIKKKKKKVRVEQQTQ